MDPSLLPNELLKTCEARLRSSIHALMLVLHNVDQKSQNQFFCLGKIQFNLVSRLLFILFALHMQLNLFSIWTFSIQIILEL